MEFNLLNEYPVPDKPRIVGKNIRTISHRIIAEKRDKDFFDGERNFGYGGYKYDGRWKIVAKVISERYLEKNNCNFLQINCEKGFLLHDLKELRKDVTVYGTETSEYAIRNSMSTIKGNIKMSLPYELDYKNNFFDFVLALGVVYTQTLDKAITLLKEIDRVSNGKSFVTLASYETKKDYFLFKDWTLLGVLLLRKEEWLEVLKLLIIEEIIGLQMQIH